MEAISPTPPLARGVAPGRFAAARTRVFWLVVGITALGAAVRLSTLGLQSYRHDEAVTAGRVLGGTFGHAMHEVWRGESTPPVYYALAWLWSQVFGVHEVGLRLLSALFGIGTIPVSFLIGRTLIGRRAGIALAALTATNPMLLWYSQDARAYALLVLFSSLGLLFFISALWAPTRRNLALWGVFSALALTTHYFAAFPVTIEAAWLLSAARTRRGMLVSLVGLAITCAALAPIALNQAGASRNSWIATFGLTGRMRETAISFASGEAGLPKHAFVPLLLAVLAVGILIAWGDQRHRRGASLFAGVGFGAMALALAAALAGQDFLLERNLLPALIPLLGVLAAGFTVPRSRFVAPLLGLALIGYWLCFDVYSDFRVQLQRDDWRSAAARIGSPSRPRAIIAWEQGDPTLGFYIGGGETRIKHKQWRAARQSVSEVDVLSGRPPPPRGASALPVSFHRVEQVTFGRMTLSRYQSSRPVRLDWGQLAGNFTGYANNAILLDGPRVMR